MAIGAYADELSISGAAMEKISPNGEWAAMRDISADSEASTVVKIWNPAKGETSFKEIKQMFLGWGNSIADNGMMVGYYLNSSDPDQKAIPYVIINGNKVQAKLPSTAANYTEWIAYGEPTYSVANNGKSFFLMGITKDGSKVVGQMSDWNGGAWFDGMNCSMLRWPFVADINANGELSNMVILPMPDYYNVKDVFGNYPDSMSAEWISDDGKTIVGMVSDSSGTYFYPVIWKNDGSKWGQPTFPTLAQITDEIPTFKARGEDPAFYDSYLESGNLLNYMLEDKIDEFKFVYSQIGWGPDYDKVDAEDPSKGRDFSTMGATWEGKDGQKFSTDYVNMGYSIGTDGGNNTKTGSFTGKLPSGDQSFNISYSAIHGGDVGTNKLKFELEGVPEEISKITLHYATNATSNPTATSRGTFTKGSDGKWSCTSTSSYNPATASVQKYVFYIKMEYPMPTFYSWEYFLGKDGVEKLNHDLIEYDSYDEQAAYTQYAQDLEKFMDNNPFFPEHSIVVNPEGNYAACTQAKAEGGDGGKVRYYIWSIDLTTGEYEKFITKYDNFNPHQVTSEGDIFAHTANLSTSYVHPANATEFIPMGKYLQATNPAAFKYIEDNLGYVNVATTTFDESTGEYMTESVLKTGLVNMTADRTVLVGGFLDMENAGNSDSYYFSGLGTDIVAAPDGDASPRSGMNVPGLTEMYLNWDYQPIKLNESKVADIKVEYADGGSVKVTDAKVEETKEGYQLALAIEEYEKGGDVTITIPAGIVEVDCWGLGSCDNSEMTVNYHVASVLPEPEVSVEGGVVEQLPAEVTFTWDEAVVLKRYPNPDYRVTLTYNGEEIEDAVSAEISQNVITVSILADYDEPGQYALSLAGGYAYDTVTEDMTPAVEVPFVILGAVSHVAVTPEDGSTLDSDAKVVVTWPDVVTLHPEATAKPTWAATRAGQEIEPTLEGNNMTFDLSGLGDGTYTLDIPEMYVKVGELGMWNNPLTLVYTIDNTTGVTLVGVDKDGLYRVYNLQGVNVLNTPNASELNNLAHGIYLVNGKKVVIR